MADIVISEFMNAEAVEGLQAEFDVLHDPELWQKLDDLAAALADARALIVRNRTQVTAEVMDAAPKLKVVGRLGVGLDNIDLDAARARNVEVYPALGGNTISVAEYVIAMTLVLLRGAYYANAAMLAGEWPREQLMGREAYGKTIGIVGFGVIGQAVAARARCLGMQAVASDAFLAEDDPAWSQADARLDLDDLLTQSDVITLHVPLTKETRGLIGADALAKVKEGAVLINTARGGVVDERALVTALTTGRLGGAALDVFETEPLSLAEAAQFVNVPNLVLTPHIAGPTQESNTRISSITADTVRRILKANSV